MSPPSSSFTPSATPRRLLGGTWRLQVERARRALVIARPVALITVTLLCGLAGAVLHPVAGLAALVGAGWLLRRSIARACRRAAWWLEWRYAARSAALVRIAELPGLDVDHNPGAHHVEVAPFVIRLDVYPAGRRYTLRALPGQTLIDFEKACDSLALRWRVEQVTAARHATRRGLLVLDVERGDALDREVPFTDRSGW